MRLHKHDELLEAMARAYRQKYCELNNIRIINDEGWKHYRDESAAALDALLKAAVELGVGRQAGHVIRNEMWNAFQGNHVDGTPQCLILRMEASDDNA